MQKKAVVMLVFGFAMGLGVASCATPTSDADRAPASQREFRADGRDCYTGEERSADGYCTRVQEIQRPARRGGR